MPLNILRSAQIILLALGLSGCARVLNEALVPPISITATQFSSSFTWNPDGPSHLSFVATGLGMNRPQVLQLNNGSGYAVNVTSARLESGVNFTIDPIPAIPANGSELLTIHFQPGTAADLQDTLVLGYTNSVGNFSLSISLAGDGLSPNAYDCSASPSPPPGYLFPAGDGTPGTPYVICTVAELNQIGTTADLMGSSFLLGADLDFTGLTPVPIGSYNPQTSTGTPFTGSFNGNGHAISNWSQTAGSTSSGGLFAYTSGATIQDLSLTSIDVSGQTDVGGLVGYAANSLILNSSVQGTITCNGSYAGGLIGYLYANGSNKISCLNSDATNVSVTAWAEVGGLVGFAWADPGATISVSGSSSQGTLLANGGPSNDHVGGLIGSLQANSATSNITVASSSSSANVQGRDTLGGLVGACSATGGTVEITGSHATGTVGQFSGDLGNTVGGLIGYLYDGSNAAVTLSQDYSTGDVTSTGSWSSAFLANATVTGSAFTMSECYSTGNFVDTGAAGSVNSNFNGQSSGGLIGLLNPTGSSVVTLSRNYYDGAIDYSSNPYTPKDIGGLAGLLAVASSTFSLANSYAVSSITLNNRATDSIGGLVGYAQVTTGSIPTISDTYASVTYSRTTNATDVGALIGKNTFTVSGSYWNNDLYATGVGSGSGAGATAETTAALQTQATFSGWDFTSIWSMPVGSMPTLQ